MEEKMVEKKIKEDSTTDKFDLNSILGSAKDLLGSTPRKSDVCSVNISGSQEFILKILGKN